VFGVPLFALVVSKCIGGAVGSTPETATRLPEFFFWRVWRSSASHIARPE
jgi:hypothetical protein